MRDMEHLGAARLGPALPVPTPALEMRIVDPRKLRQALLRLCTGKQFSVEPSPPPAPALVGVGRRPAFAR